MIRTTSGRGRLVAAGTVVLSLVAVWSVRLLDWDYTSTWKAAQDSLPILRQPEKPFPNAGAMLPHVEDYWQQVFSLEHPPPLPHTALKEACDRASWSPADEFYLRCGGMAAGMTSIMSQIKVCLKMAVDIGSHIVLPAMPLRNSTHLLEFNFNNPDAYMTYDQWFDEAHLREQMAAACPKMKIIHPDELDKTIAVKNWWRVDLNAAPGYVPLQPYFWVGRSFKAFFDDQYRQLVAASDVDPARDDSKAGITLVDIASTFLSMRITDDPTQRELRLWNDLSDLVRFREEPRRIVDRLLRKIPRPYYGVHFRVENDSLWSPLEHQLGVDLDALDRAWARYGRAGLQKPLVYLACGDQGQVAKFVAAGAERGWEVTHKWLLMRDDPETTGMIDSLAFDFQGAVDMGIMVRSQFYIGVTGSAFSSTVANQRDGTGRYRGSSFTVADDQGARNHLFNDADGGNMYPCCL